MRLIHTPPVKMTVNASGAVAAAKQGDVVVIVDVIDMSSTLEAALEAGACAVLGAAPDDAAPPVEVDPEAVGFLAGQTACSQGVSVIVVAEPRVGTEQERRQRITKATAGLNRAGVAAAAVLPNLGAETVKLYEMRHQVVLAVTATGGTAYDAALQAGAPAVLTGTIARTIRQKGLEPARLSAARAVKKARELDAGITVVAASANSLEDILGAEYITRLVIEEYLG